MDKIKIGVIGIGSMGSQHLEFIKKINNLELTAICDCQEESLRSATEKYNVKGFSDYKELFKSRLIDAVLIATPHYAHTPITIDAFEAGLHVLTEKPIAAHIADAQKMIIAHKNHPELKWGAMFQQRTLNIYQKLKNILESKKYGDVKRINYIITDWFRTQAYYDSGSWRATWEGEGGGVLLNQCPHQLDLFQWFFGMPKKIKAFCGIGKFHKIEVEDDVTAYMEYDNGATAIFVTSTGDAPGTNRLEITADKAKIILENNKIMITENSCSASEFLVTSKEGFATPETEENEITFKEDTDTIHQNVIRIFADSIQKDTPLVAEGEEGLNSVMLANCMLYSSLKDETVKLPLDSAAYEKTLKALIANSNFVKNEEVKLDSTNFKSSFNS